jgi:predicted RNA-binding Zn-ribbon protein involved in translation (DUF1610 family)
MDKEKVDASAAAEKHACPNCGFCPHCGRSDRQHQKRQYLLMDR